MGDSYSAGRDLEREMERHKIKKVTEDEFTTIRSQQGSVVHSTSDERTINNVMRHEYKVLSDIEKHQMQDIKDLGLKLHEYLNEIGDSRELSVARTKVEEAVMWAVKHITK